MTVESVESAVQEIRACARKTDDEGAHCLEDRLRYSVLAAIAEGHPDAAALAKAAIKTEELDFCRWYA